MSNKFLDAIEAGVTAVATHRPQYATLEARAEGQPIVILPKQRGFVKGEWPIYCPACDFSFHRTKIDIARGWAVEHNVTVHDGKLSVMDQSGEAKVLATPKQPAQRQAPDLFNF